MKRIDRLMKTRHISVADLALRVNITQGHASLIKSGKRNPSLGLAGMIARLLDWPLGDIIFGYNIGLKPIGTKPKGVQDAQVKGREPFNGC